MLVPVSKRLVVPVSFQGLVKLPEPQQSPFEEALLFEAVVLSLELAETQCFFLHKCVDFFGN